jgi:hypothetical protein
MTKYLLICPILFLFSCQQQEPEKEVFSLYTKQDVNDIVMSVLAHDSLPVNKNLKAKDSLVNGTRVSEPFILDIQSDLIKLYIFRSDTSRPQLFIHFAGISELIRFRSGSQTYFELADSTYLMFQNDHMAASSLKSSELPNLSFCEHTPGKKCFSCIKLSMPLFSKANELAYLEMFSSNGHSGYFLRKIKKQWILVQKIGFAIA